MMFRPSTLLRHYVALSTLATAAISFLSPESLNARALEHNGVWGSGLLMIMSALSLVLIFDAIFSSLKSDLPTDKIGDKRHLILIALALVNVANGFVVVAFSPDSGWLAIRFCLDGTFAALVAFLDLFQRHGGKKCCK